MSNEIQPFEFEGNKVRALSDGDEVMFVASDIAKILGYRDAAALTRTLDDEEKGTRPIDTHGGTQTMTVISEPRLYKAILQRQTGRMEVEVTREFVKRFQRWVTHEVLPQIRRTGGYIPTTDAVAASDGTCLIGELAKMLRQNGLDIGQNRLFEILRQDGYLGKNGSNRNVPTQKAMDLGLFRIKETAITHSDGHVTINRTAKVTGKGQTYFISRYCPPADDE